MKGDDSLNFDTTLIRANSRTRPDGMTNLELEHF
jgi:hypothetical protein